MVPDMQKQSAAWWLTIEGIESPLERYDFPARELPLQLRTLVKKLDAIEGNHLLHNLVMLPDQALTSKKAFNDWSLCT